MVGFRESVFQKIKILSQSDAFGRNGVLVHEIQRATTTAKGSIV